MKMLALLSVASISLFAMACSGNDGAQDDTAATSGDEALTSAQKAVFAGSWDAKKSDMLFHTYSFKTDGTYSAVGGCAASSDPGTAHCGAISEQNGKWKVVKSGPQLGAPGGVLELVLTDSFGQKDVFFYTMKDDVLSLADSYRGKTSTFEHDISTLKHLRSGDTCADKDNNTIGQCPADLPCEFDGPDANAVQRCLPPI